MIGSVDLGHLLTIIGIVAVINVINLIDGVDGLAAGRLRDLGGDARGDRALARPHRAPACSPRSPPAARSASCATASRRRRASWATRARTCSATCSAAIAVQGALKTNAVVALFFPLIVLAVPILDTGFVIAKRIKYRQPIYRADRWHFHHRMANIGFSQRRTLAYLYGWALVMAGLALALRFVPYSDDHGNFDPRLDGGDRRLPGGGARGELLPRVTLEILKLRTARLRASCFGSRGRRARRRRGRRGRRPGARDRELPGGRPGNGRVRSCRCRLGSDARSRCYKRVTSGRRSECPPVLGYCRRCRPVRRSAGTGG